MASGVYPHKPDVSLNRSSNPHSPIPAWACLILVPPPFYICVMDSALVQAVTNVQLYNYASFVIITAVWYDYILTFSEEVEYIWCQSWSWVSAMFVIARYFGLCSITLRSLWWNSLINASSTDPFQGNLMAMIGGWSFWIFFCCADLVMILRLWALYTRSKFILISLLMLYAVELVSFFVDYVITDLQFPRNPLATATLVLGTSTCQSARVFLVFADLQTIAQLALGAWMCLLVVIQFIKESIHMYKVARRFMFSEYQKVLVWEGVVYFTVVLAFAIICQLANTGRIPGDQRQVLYAALQQTLPFMLFPRFVLSLREMYARELEGRLGDGVDGAIGASQPKHAASRHSVLFAGISRNTECDDGMEVEMELRSQREITSVSA